MSSTIAVKSNPKLWEKVKQEVLRSPKGGPAGKWSARKAQLSVKLYKSRGGSYKGKRSPTNSLTKWSREKWGYISPKGARSKKGRYLPEVIRKNLSPSQKRSENRKKGSKRGKWVPYGSEVKRLMHKHGIIKGSIRSPRGRQSKKAKGSVKKVRSCWKGYRRVPGKTPGSKGSCVKA